MMAERGGDRFTALLLKALLCCLRLPLHCSAANAAAVLLLQCCCCCSAAAAALLLLLPLLAEVVMGTVTGAR